MGSAGAVRLIGPQDRSAGHQTPGMHREMAASSDRSWAGYVTTEAGMVSAWHHHADFESHIYVLAGVMRIESGPEGEHVIEAHAGDFIFVPPQTIHREINPGSEPSVVVVVRAGTGEAVVNVDGPGPS